MWLATFSDYLACIVDIQYVQYKGEVASLEASPVTANFASMWCNHFYRPTPVDSNKQAKHKITLQI
jgi:hypothetical protein